MTDIFGKRPVLVLAPHTDDGEFGCGGTIAKLIGRGAQVHYAAFSVCEESVPDGFPKDTLEKEVKHATAVLGIPKANLRLYPYKVRYFFRNRQDILEDLVKLQRELEPGLVIAPTTRDLHQDHQIVAVEARRAFKRTTIVAYEMPWNNVDFSTQLFVKLQSSHVATKVKALCEYKSQAHRPYASESFLRGLATARGVSIGCEYAEAFEVVRWVID